MEETIGVTGATTPAESTTPAAPEVTPVTPAAQETPKPAEATQAAIEAASVPAEVPTEPAPQVEAAAAEQPSEEQVAKAAIEVTDAMISLAVDLIRKTGRSSAAHFQKKMGLALDVVNALLNELTAKNVLGPENGTRPREILIKVDPKPTTPPPAPKQQPPKPQKAPMQQRPKVTDYDRLQGWKKHLAEIGHYTDQGFIDAMADYAMKNPGFNPRSKWGSCLIVMVNRLANKTKNSLRTFSPSDAEYLQKELLRFFQEDPLGDGPAVWNSTYTTNAEQRSVINKFFFGQDASNRDLFRELKGKQALVMTAVRDAAWPNQMEEKNGTGGTFAERFHYLAMAIIRFATSDFEKALWENSYHSSPTEEFLERVGGKRPNTPPAPSWFKDGKCKECGSDVVKDSQGNDICSNPICMNHYARVATDAPKSFRAGGRPRPQSSVPTSFDPAQAPLPSPDGERRRNWKDKKDRRHDHDDAERAFAKGGKKHGKRFRVNDGDDFEPDQPTGGNEDVVVASVGGEFPGNNAFANLTLPTAPAEEKLPEPPPEQPIV